MKFKQKRYNSRLNYKENNEKAKKSWRIWKKRIKEQEEEKYLIEDDKNDNELELSNNDWERRQKKFKERKKKELEEQKKKFIEEIEKQKKMKTEGLEKMRKMIGY